MRCETRRGGANLRAGFCLLPSTDQDQRKAYMSISHASKSRKHRRDADDLRRDVEAKALAQQVSPEGEVPSPPLAEPAEFLSPSSGQAADFSNDPPADDDADVIAINGGGEAKTGTVQV